MHKKTALDHYPKNISERIDLLYQRITQRQNLPPSLKPFLESILRRGCTDIFPFEYSMPSEEMSSSTAFALFFFKTTKIGTNYIWIYP